MAGYGVIFHPLIVQASDKIQQPDDCLSSVTNREVIEINGKNGVFTTKSFLFYRQSAQVELLGFRIVASSLVQRCEIVQ